MQKRLYNLDGLRFLAAWVVLLCHLEILKAPFGLPGSNWRFFSNSAQVAVTFFFVLSGFLITYLLLLEKKKNAKDRINLGRFYKKRILRIWPLYYLLLVLAFFIFTKSDFFQYSSAPRVFDPTLFSRRLPGYSLFLPNTTEWFYGKHPYLGQTWSLGVEDFFYLFFPLGLYFTRWRNVPKLLWILVLLFSVLSVGVFILSNHADQPNRLIGIVYYYLDRYRIYGFAMGGLAAWWLLEPVRKDGWIFTILRSRNTSAGLLLLSLLLVGGGITFSFATQQAYSVFFALILFSFTASGIRFSLLNHPFLVYLGKISYGIYMLHPLAIIIVLKLAKPYLRDNVGTAILLAVAATIITIVLAVVSYEGYEKYFLRYRSKKKKERVSG